MSEALIMEHWRQWSTNRNIPSYEIWVKDYLKEINETRN